MNTTICFQSTRYANNPLLAAALIRAKTKTFSELFMLDLIAHHRRANRAKSRRKTHWGNFVFPPSRPHQNAFSLPISFNAIESEKVRAFRYWNPATWCNELKLHFLRPAFDIGSIKSAPEIYLIAHFNFITRNVIIDFFTCHWLRSKSRMTIAWPLARRRKSTW